MRTTHGRCLCWSLPGGAAETAETSGRWLVGRAMTWSSPAPPYYDLEIYSDDPADLSNMTWEDFRTAYREIIAESCKLLSDNRFAVFVVGDVRDKRGFYRDLIGETKQAFADCGCLLYNEIIKLDPFGTAGARARRLFGNRKVVRVHQHVLVFYKGDPTRIKQEFGEVQLPESEDDF